MKYIVTFFILMLPMSIIADPVYKSVDEKGKVTYSSEPPPKSTGAKKVDLPPPPAKEQVLQSKQQQEDIKRKSDSLAQEQKKAAGKVVKKKVEEDVEPLAGKRKSTLNDPGRQGQQPKIVHPISKGKK